MQYNKKISEDNRGFSLLELIVTVVILALVTAPFLSSFVTASNTNVKSKRIQEANELSQYIIEQCKAMSLDKIESASVYNLTVTGGEKKEDYNIDNTDKAYDKDSTSYAWTISGSELPEGYSDNYSADVKITPVKSVVNADEAIPEIDDVNKENCMVLRQKIYKNDSMYSDLFRRDINIYIDYDSTAPDKKYSVTYSITYLNHYHTSMGKVEETFNYDEVPSVYLLYTPVSSEDSINVYNRIDSSGFGADGDKKVNLYLIEQAQPDGSLIMQPGRQRIKENVTDSIHTTSLENLLYTDGAGFKNTVIYSNIKDSSKTINDIKDKNDTVNASVKTIKVDTLYDIDVTIKYSGKEVSTFSSTKLELN